MTQLNECGLALLPTGMRTSELWNSSLTVQQNNWEWDYRLTNENGPVFPALSDPTMIALFNIEKSQRVVDIGGGDAHFSRADVVTDAFPDMNAHRSGRAMDRSANSDYKFVECFAENLPFADYEFDFAYSRSVFEHTVDPAAACREMMRIAPRGYIETPSPLAEYLGGHPTHRWIIQVEPSEHNQPVLVFKRKPFVCAPFSYLLRAPFFQDLDFHFRWEWQYRNLISTQFAWEGSFEFRVEDAEVPTSMNYDAPELAAAAHLDCAVCSLQFGDVPMDIITPDIDEALTLAPYMAGARNARGCALFFSGQRQDAIYWFKMAVEAEPNNNLYRQNLEASLSADQSPVIRIVEDAYAVPDMNPDDIYKCGLTIDQLESALMQLLGPMLMSGSPRIRQIKQRFAALKRAITAEEAVPTAVVRNTRR